MMDGPELFLKCDCGTEGIELQFMGEPRSASLPNLDSGEKLDDTDYTLYLSIWELGTGSKKYTFKDKLRYVWRVFTKNKPFGDQICLQKEKIIQLRNYLNTVSDILS
jgi:hypothetical protein